MTEWHGPVSQDPHRPGKVLLRAEAEGAVEWGQPLLAKDALRQVGDVRVLFRELALLPAGGLAQPGVGGAHVDEHRVRQRPGGDSARGLEWCGHHGLEAGEEDGSSRGRLRGEGHCRLGQAPPCITGTVKVTRDQNAAYALECVTHCVNVCLCAIISPR